jgi:hypothetical protein
MPKSVSIKYEPNTPPARHIVARNNTTNVWFHLILERFSVLPNNMVEYLTKDIIVPRLIMKKLISKNNVSLLPFWIKYFEKEPLKSGAPVIPNIAKIMAMEIYGILLKTPLTSRISRDPYSSIIIPAVRNRVDLKIA